MEKFTILHLSDLHIGKNSDFDRSLVLDPLIERVKIDSINGIRPEIVIITGDVSNCGIESEYLQAKSFFDQLLSCLGLSDDRIFIVPGNHDINYAKYPLGEIPQYECMKDLNNDLMEELHRKNLLRGMGDYFKFIKANYSHLKSEHGDLIPFVVHYKSTCGKNIGLIGLNSAWMCRKKGDKNNIAIGEYQVKNAINGLKSKGTTDITINCFHHPLEMLWDKDRERCKYYFNNSFLLSGHLHSTNDVCIEDPSGKFFRFQTGCSYVDSESQWPQRYQYITFDWGRNHIRLDFRKFSSGKCKWHPESDEGIDGTKTFEEIPNKSRHLPSLKSITPTENLKIFQPGGMLPEDAVSYIKRQCDDELAQHIKSNRKKLIAVNGEFGIGKSSLLNRVMHVPFLGDGKWKRYFCDVQSAMPNDLKNFEEYFFREFSEQLCCTVDSWKTLNLFLQKQPIVLCFDEFGILSKNCYAENSGHFIQNLCVLCEKFNNFRMVVALKDHIDEFMSRFPEKEFENPKFRHCWQSILVNPFNEMQTRQILDLLPEAPRSVALDHIDVIQKFSAFTPKKTQCLCDNLMDAYTGTSDISIYLEIINKETSYR